MKSMTYGTLPTREEFDAAFERECPSTHAYSPRGPFGTEAWRECAHCSDGIFTRRHDTPHGKPGTFHFTNDPRVGTCELTASELWRELVKAQEEWANGCNGVECDGDPSACVSEAAGQWCSDVLGVLGFEWI